MIYPLALIFLVVFSVFTFGGGFGSGAMFVVLSVFTIPLVLIGLVAYCVRKKYRFWNDWHSLIRFIIIAVLLMGLTSSPTWGTALISNYCYHQNIMIGNQIITGIEQYRSNTGQLPASSDDLVPNFLSEWPESPCKLLSGRSYIGIEKPRYTYSTSNEEYGISVETVPFIFVQYYASKSKTWSYYDPLP